MAHFAEIDSNNTVLRVLVVDNSQEHRGQEFLADDCGLGGTWVQTSYNANFGKEFASVGGTYDPVEKTFKSPKPLPSWVFNTEIWSWEAPIPRPDDGKTYTWDEPSLTWIETII
jgi:hypothetical protein